jgi:hypothetical protein
VFAKKHLPALCDEMGIAYVRWETFDDISMALEVGVEALTRPAPERCPGWTTATS